MLTQFKMDCRLHKADFLVYLLGELGGFLLGQGAKLLGSIRH